LRPFITFVDDNLNVDTGGLTRVINGLKAITFVSNGLEAIRLTKVMALRPFITFVRPAVSTFKLSSTKVSPPAATQRKSVPYRGKASNTLH
jgi:hypothetical protein